MSINNVNAMVRFMASMGMTFSFAGSTVSEEMAASFAKAVEAVEVFVAGKNVGVFFSPVEGQVHYNGLVSNQVHFNGPVAE